MLLEEKLTYKLRGCFYDLRNKYGRHHSERIYDRALDEQFISKNISFISKPKIDIYSLDSGRKIGIYVPDKLVEDSVIIEIKAKPFTSKDDEMQLIEYLKASKYEIGYLVNFGESEFNPKRFIYTNDRKSFLQDR